MFKKLICCVIIVATALLFTACANGAGSSDKGYNVTTLRFVNQRPTATLARHSWIMREQKLLEKYLPDDVEVEWINMDVQTDIRDALVTGHAEIAILPISQLIVAESNGMKFNIVSNYISCSTSIYSTRENIRSLDDITSTDKISTSSILSLNHMSLVIASKELYNDPGRFDLNMMPMPFADMWTSVANTDDLACQLLVFPDSVLVENYPNMHMVMDLSEYIDMYSMGATACTTEKFYNENPVIIEAFRKASKEAADFIESNPRAAAEILAQEHYWNIDPSAAEVELLVKPPSYEISESAYDKAAGLLYEIGAVDKQPIKFSELANYEEIPKKK